MKMNFLFIISLSVSLFSQDRLKTDASNEIEMLIYQNTKLSKNFFVNYTIGKQATENIRMQFYMLPLINQRMVMAHNATVYNLNWAEEIHMDQTNTNFRGINPIGLLYVLSTWAGIVPDPSTKEAMEKMKREFVKANE